MDQRQLLKNIEASREWELKRQEKAEREFWKHPDTARTLEECLQRLTKNDLDEIRRFYDFRGVSQLNKQDLIQVLSEGVPSLFEKKLSLLKEEQYNLITKMAQNDGRTSAEGYSQYQAVDLVRHGLAFPVTNEDQRLFVLPDELIDAFQKADNNELRKRVKLNSEWPLLINGMLHYYGYMSSKDIREALTNYTGETINQHQFFTIIEQIPYHEKGFEYVYAKNGFKDIVADDPHKIEQEQKARPDLGFYRFTKAHLLEVGEDSMDFFSEEMEGFFKVVERYYDVDRDFLEDMGFDLETLIRNGTNMQELLNEMQKRLEIPDEKVLKELMQALVEAHNDTRMYSLKGHKPNELKEQEVESNVVPMRRAQKVGRNEPCPCGSGKKYKKCCGK